MHCNKYKEVVGTADMEKPACSVIAMVVLALVLNAPGTAQAQICADSQAAVLYVSCYGYLEDTLTYPDTSCCDEVGYLYKLEGADCFCDEVRSLTALYPTSNANKASSLLRDCKLSAGASCSTTPSSAPPASPVSPSLPTPGSIGGINTPIEQSSPSSTTNEPPGSLNLAAPIGGSVGGITALGIILILIGKFTNMFSRCCNCHWFVNVGGRNGNDNAKANAGLPQHQPQHPNGYPYPAPGGLPQHYPQQPNGYPYPTPATANQGRAPPSAQVFSFFNDLNAAENASTHTKPDTAVEDHDG
uniref:Bifunctional inhibitor/plant lipid transfer protein/seed storage helical domain-containing protein n=1 Tax=Physcomitrium patens TaxID=3218 RepID=A0A7I4AY16_PHYPA